MPYTQEQINKGQTYVNYELVRVDEKLINIFHMLVEMLKQTRAVPPSAASPSASARQITVDTIEAAITEVATISSKVAGIKPPGCEPPPPPEYNP